MLLSVRNLIKDFPRGKNFWGRSAYFSRAVDQVSLEIGRGEIVGLVGESGCGKSTLGREMLALTPLTSGEVFWNGENISSLGKNDLRLRRKNFQMVFQNPQTALNPRHRILKVLTEPLRVLENGRSGESKKLAVQILEKVGMRADDLSKYPHEFSGGQRQRIGLARAMVLQPQLIVLDEPLSALDLSVQASVLNLLMKLNREEKTAYFFISHDLNVVGYMSQRILVMYLGRIVEAGETTKVLKNPRHPYTQALLQTLRSKETRLKGEAPTWVARPRGCVFHTRCAFAEEKCEIQAPELLEVKPGWKVACWKVDGVSSLRR
ncbi:MAG: ABC transporter ATP-binding protein [bacterium]